MGGGTIQDEINQMEEQRSSSAKSAVQQEMMSDKQIAAVSYKPNPGSSTSFLESVTTALFNFFGFNVQVPSNTTPVSDQSPDLVHDPSTTAVDQTSAGVVIVARGTLGTGGGAKTN